VAVVLGRRGSSGVLFALVNRRSGSLSRNLHTLFERNQMDAHRGVQMSERSGQFGNAEQIALAVACVLVLFGAAGIWKGALGAPDAGRDFALAYVLAAGVALTVGTLAASAYRSRSQIDIDRLEQAAKELRAALSLEEAKNLRTVFQAANVQVAGVKEVLDTIAADVSQVGINARNAASANQAISKLTGDLSDLLLAEKKERFDASARAAVGLMTAWELSNATWTADIEQKNLSRVSFYEQIKGLLLEHEDSIFPTPVTAGWAICDGDFELIENDTPADTISSVSSYSWKSTRGGPPSGSVRGVKSAGRKAAVSGSGASPVEPTSSSLERSTAQPGDGSEEARACLEEMALNSNIPIEEGK